MVNEKGIIMCPRARGMAPIEINLVEIKKLEHRLDEIAFVNLMKAPELLAAFTRIYSDLSDFLASLESEKCKAERDARTRRSIILVDDMPKLLREKGLTTSKSPTGSADTREAILELDSAYQEALEVVEQIQCVIRFLKDKREAFSMGYHAVKRILEKLQPGLSRHINASPDGDNDIGDNNGTTNNGFGIPTYR